MLVTWPWSPVIDSIVQEVEHLPSVTGRQIITRGLLPSSANVPVASMNLGPSGPPA